MSGAHHTPEWHRARRLVARVITAKLEAGAAIPCVNCGRPIVLGQRWDVGHIVDASAGGGVELSNLGGAHRSCNRKDGGRLGAAKTNRA